MIGRDRTSHSATSGETLAVIQPLLSEDQLDSENCSRIFDSRIPSLRTELFLIENEWPSIPTKNIKSRESDIHFDYHFDGTPTPDRYTNSKFVVRRAAGKYLRSVCMAFPPAGELELATYGRQHFLSKFKSGECLSLPFLNFIDGFGLYRNMYRTLMGIYIILSGMNVRDHSRRSNVFAITLGPHGSSFHDIIESLVALRELDEGIIMEINGEQRFVCAFPQAYIGDMPQQNENSGFKRQNAIRGCGKCIATQKEFGNLDFDILRLNRSHYETMIHRQKAEKMRKTAAVNFYKEWGMKEKPSPLEKISPALDIIQTRPLDPAHSELAGISRALQRLLFSAILTQAGQQAYVAELRIFPFPPGWGRLQSPLYHLESYRMSELARASIIIPVLLRCWLRHQFVERSYLMCAERVFRDIMVEYEISAVDAIVFSFAMVAKSNCLLLSQSLTSEIRGQLAAQVRLGRKCYQLLHEAAAQTIEGPRRSCRRSVSQSQTSVLSLSEEMYSPSTVGSTSTNTLQADDDNNFMNTNTTKDSESKNKYRACQRRPNVHAGLHAQLTALFFATPNNITTFIGEDKHRGVEKTLLLAEVFQQSLRLILLGAYAMDDPDATALMKRLAQSCPVLIENLLPPTERHDNPDESEVAILQDEHHGSPSALVAIERKEIRRRGLPLFPHKLNMMDDFRTKLRSAYENDYGFNSAAELHKQPLHYAQKLAFDDRHPRPTTPLQIENIFLHEIGPGQRRLFIRVKPTILLSTPDAVLHCPVLELLDTVLIVGLPAISPKKLYIVPVDVSRVTNEIEGLERVGGEELQEGRMEELLLQLEFDIDFL
ncbi:MAG: hypothetical protein M1830_008388 [Pleopsidium flavum]|nr:MAG: hypothetical protein M1830_008388 [Pleopsidium flavum]